MKVLSIDVGIKNLAICVINLQDKKDIDKYKFNIEKLEIVNLIDDQKYLCQFEVQDKDKDKNKNKNKSKTTTLCNKQAKYTKNNCCFCKNHATKNNDYILPTSEFNKIQRLKLDELIKIANDYNINYEKKSKVYLIESIQKFINNKVFDNIGEIKCNEISLIDISKAIKKKLDLFLNNIENIDYVLIENQISPIANRMNCIQGMLTQYFINNNIFNIQYISAINKLKEFIGDEKLNYNERKKKSISITSDIINEVDMNLHDKENIVNNFMKSKKQDDLADCFLQAIWFLKKY